MKFFVVFKVWSTTYTKYRLQIYITFLIIDEFIIYIIQYVLATIILLNSSIHTKVRKVIPSKYFNSLYLYTN
jgi:hypothetical protein